MLEIEYSSFSPLAHSQHQGALEGCKIMILYFEFETTPCVDRLEAYSSRLCQTLQKFSKKIIVATRSDHAADAKIT